MMIYDVIGSVPLNGNTSAVINGNGECIKNGIDILDEFGETHRVLSVAMTSSGTEESLKKTTLLIAGKFMSSKIYV